MSLGKAIEALREARGWQQGKLAAYAEMDQSHLSKIEAADYKNITARTLGRIAGALGVTTDELYEAAGWLTRQLPPRVMTEPERSLLDTIRAVPSPAVRYKLLEQLTWIAQITRDADAARQPLFKLAAEQHEEYRSEGSSGADEDGSTPP